MLSLVDEADRALVQNCLATLRARTLPLLTPDVVVSGDPNPLNWGVLPSGQVVLFDWERVGLGPAAFDLAITVPGLGDKQAYQQVAAAYLSCEIVPVSSRAVDALARAIALCKVAVVCEFVGTLAHRSLTTAAQREWLRLQLPAWLCKLEAWTG
jgi:Ser/Thr protein kinase RdoA (MazF antagonist)